MVKQVYGAGREHVHSPTRHSIYSAAVLYKRTPKGIIVGLNERTVDLTKKGLIGEKIIVNRQVLVLFYHHKD